MNKNILVHDDGLFLVQQGLRLCSWCRYRGLVSEILQVVIDFGECGLGGSIGIFSKVGGDLILTK